MTQSILSATPLTPSQSGSEAVINPANSPEQRRAAAVDARTRIPMSVPQAKLSSPELPGFHLHWMNDEPGRIEQAIKAGYSFVDKEDAVLISTDLASGGVAAGTDLGTRVSQVVGRNANGEPLRSYLMKIPLEWFQEDQAGIQERVSAAEATIRAGRQRVDGETDPADIAARYVKTHNRKVNFSRSA